MPRTQFPTAWTVLKRPLNDPQRSADPSVMSTVSEILTAIERDGETAIRKYSAQFDSWDPPSFEITAEQVRQSEAALPVEFREAWDRSALTVRAFAEHQRSLLVDTTFEPRPGVTIGHRQVPIQRVGSYAPGGRYPLVSSPLMSVIVPKAAGVSEVVMCTPPQPGGDGPTPAMVWVGARAGADAMFCIGGIPALAAMTFGLCGIEPVEFLCGAGNAYVAEAKRQLFGRVGIDLLAGPSEVAVLCDVTANPVLVAADLLGQAEHGPNSPASLITTDAAMAYAVMAEIERQLPLLSTGEVAGAAWRDWGMVLVARDRHEAVEICDWIACEHLEVQTADDDWYAARLRNYGSLFLGADSTVTYSDKGCTGTNHTLPTQGSARYTGGLSVAKFLKTLTWQRVHDPVAARQVAEDAAQFGAVDGLYGHALTAELRLQALDRLDQVG